MTEIRSDVYAAQLLRAGKTVSEVVEATGLEPKEVMGIAQKQKLTAVKSEPESLTGLAAALRREAGLARYPKRAQTLLGKAAASVDAALAAIEADSGKAQIRAEIARLDARKKELQAQLRGGATAPATDMAAVRAWARDNGYDVPPKGVLRRDVVDAYLRAVAS